MTEREALADLLEAVDLAIYSGDWKVDGACDPDAAIQRARNVLSQPEPLYLAFMDTPQRTWIELTDDEISACSKGNMTRNGFARTIESKLKEKNT